MRRSMSYGLASRVNDKDAVTISSYITSLFGPDSVLPKSPTDMPGYQATVRPFGDESLT